MLLRGCEQLHSFIDAIVEMGDLACSQIDPRRECIVGRDRSNQLFCALPCASNISCSEGDFYFCEAHDRGCRRCASRKLKPPLDSRDPSFSQYTVQRSLKDVDHYIAYVVFLGNCERLVPPTGVDVGIGQGPCCLRHVGWCELGNL
jgi:hypothetical protein